MSLTFQSLQEFLQARDKGEIDLSDFNVLLDKLDFKKLVALFSKNFFIRLANLKKWIRQVGRVCGIKIKLKTSLSAHRPYMLEGGVIGLSFKDLLKPSYSFFAIAHETAHFILMCNDGYAKLKAFDREYHNNTELNSPIEYCANIITLTIFERCICVTQKVKRREKIAEYINSLKLSMAENCSEADTK